MPVIIPSKEVSRALISRLMMAQVRKRKLARESGIPPNLTSRDSNINQQAGGVSSE